MPTKTILTAAQRSKLFDPPTDVSAIERLYTLGSEDLAEILKRRRAANRLGFAVQLSYLRFPGRPLRPEEMPSPDLLSMLAKQAACLATDFDDYAGRSTTLREHRAEAEAFLRLRPFSRADMATMMMLGTDTAASTDRGEMIVAAMVKHLQENRIVLPASSQLERIALVARARARKAALRAMIHDLTICQEAALDQLLVTDPQSGSTPLAWLKDAPESPSAKNLKGLIERLDHIRTLGIEPDRARRLHANRYKVIAREGAIMSAQHVSRLAHSRRLATLVAFVIEMEVALTDASIFMMEKMIGSMFRRAAHTRSERLQSDAARLKETARIHAKLGRRLLNTRWSDDDPRQWLEDTIGWGVFERSVKTAEALSSTGDDGFAEILERYPTMRKFAPAFLNAFTFRASRPSDPLISAVQGLAAFYLEKRKAFAERPHGSFLKPKWRKVVFDKTGGFDRRAYEMATMVHLRERLASGSIWVDGSRAYRTLDDYLLPRATCQDMRAAGELGLAIAPDFKRWIADRRSVMSERFTQVDRKARTGQLPDAIIEHGILKISPQRKSVPDEANQLKARIFAIMPRIRITELLAEVTGCTGFADRFNHVRTGDTTRDHAALMGTILADATNLGLSRMAESSRGLTHARLLWTAQWHIRDETYTAALASIIDYHQTLPNVALWGLGDTSSSDGQFFRAGAKGEARADRNARYGSDAGVLFYTHVSDRYSPFHSKVIAANAGEAAHVIDGLLNHESGITIREHATDTAGAVDHVFGLCHLLGFRFAPRIRDLNERRLYALAKNKDYKALGPLIAGPINVKVIEDNWDDVLRLAASIKAGTVTASVMLKKLSGYPRQNPIARALREIGRVERTLFMFDWFDDPSLRRRTNANLNKGEARNALARAVFFNRLGELRDRTFENQRHRASGLNLTAAAIIVWNTVYIGRAATFLRKRGETIPDEILAHVAPLGWEHISLTGDYLWAEIDKPRSGFRPLRASPAIKKP